MGICNFFLPPAIPLHFLFHFIFISSHLLSSTPLNYFHPSLLVLYHYYCPTDYKKSSCAVKTQFRDLFPPTAVIYVIFLYFFFFFLCTLEGEILTSVEVLCQQLPVFALPTPAIPSSGPQGSSQMYHRVQSRCYWYLICSGGANGHLLTFTKPVLFLVLLQSHIPWPELRAWHTDCWGLAISLCPCKKKIYHYWFNQAFLWLETESEEQAKLLSNAQ